MMNYSLPKRIIGAVIGLINFIVFYLTVQPSVSFWDCGEVSAAAFSLQVPHPPGSPLMTLLGRLFAMLPIAANNGLRINLLSVTVSAFTSVALYFIIIKLIENYRGKNYLSLGDAMLTYLSAAIGALAFAFSHSFWFNGTESEIYAANTLVFALIIFFGMIWNERADQKDSTKYILLIAYLIGLSIGLRLFGVLTIVTITMIVMFRKYVDDEDAMKKSGFIFLGHVAILLVLALLMWANETGTTPPSPEDYKSFDLKFKMLMLAVSAAYMGVFWKKIFNRNSIYIAIIIGVVSKFIIFDLIMKQTPEVLGNLAGDSIGTAALLLAIVIGALAYVVYYSIKHNKPTLNVAAMSIIFIFIGYLLYASVMIRANVNPPMNENDPKNFTQLVSYLNREQYGDWPTFKRRFSTEANQQGIYSNYSSDLDFLWRYQLNHMMTRYILWTFSGRESWDQDAVPNMWPFNGIANGFGKLFNLHFAGDSHNSFFGIPFFIGLIGLFFHFRKDWKMATAFFILFIFVSYLFAFYQNQQEPQPRERDKFLAALGFVFAIWIGIGIRNIIDYVKEKVKSPSLGTNLGYGVLVLGFLFIPFRMLQANYYEHDRSKNWVPWDYAYNLLQTCAPNAILFTQGDNDTFPLWYLQDVEGVRRDVRIANLSLLNTNWYIKELKNTAPYGTPKVPIRFSDEEIERVTPIEWQPQDVTIPVPQYVYKQFGISDTSISNKGKIVFRMNNTMEGQGYNAIRVQDIMIKEIIEATNWTRPIYFAVTGPRDAFIGLDHYLQVEGLAMRLVPFSSRETEPLNAAVVYKNLFDNPVGFSKSFRSGYKFRGINDPNIFFEDNQTRLMLNYRNAFLRLSDYYQTKGDNVKAIEVLDRMQKIIPSSKIPIDYRLLFDVANTYYKAGKLDKYKELAKTVETGALAAMEQDPTFINSYYSPYRLLFDIYGKLQEYQKELAIWQKLSTMYPNDPQIVSQIARLNNLINQEKK